MNNPSLEILGPFFFTEERNENIKGEKPLLFLQRTIMDFLKLQSQNKEVGNFRLKSLNR